MIESNNSNGPNPDSVRKMFSSVAKNYDLANSVLSLGIHHLWRKKLVRLSGAKAGMSVLDCATGTGDLALEFKKTVGPTGEVIGTDFCADMLHFAPSKAMKKNLDVKFEIADVTNLQFEDNRFDLTSISFGIRNVNDPAKGISEMARVTKPKGKVIVLEFGQMSLPLVSQIYSFYSENVLPKIGGMITGDSKAYEYLQKSSSKFPCKQNFVNLMKSTGQFSEVKFWSLSGGIAYIYIGTKN